MNQQTEGWQKDVEADVETEGCRGSVLNVLLQILPAARRHFNASTGLLLSI